MLFEIIVIFVANNPFTEYYVKKNNIIKSKYGFHNESEH